jgi:hypothetical protein
MSKATTDDDWIGHEIKLTKFLYGHSPQRLKTDVWQSGSLL